MKFKALPTISHHTIHPQPNVTMSKPITCSSCHMMLQFPPNATAIRCTNCQSVVRIPTQNNGLSAPPTNGYNNNYKLPLSQQPAGSLPLAQGNKKALIIGISYKNSDNELKGCINDAKLMSYLLINKFKYPESSIRMLTDEGTDPNRIPTKRNIQSALLWLVQDCKAGDSLVFHYSGHGKRMRNHTLDEKDGYDEAIVPLDYEKQGVIVDDEINATIVRPLPQGVTLHAIMDCCNSGTVLDLPYLCQIRYKQYQWEDHRPRSGIWQGTGGGIAISISGCDDDQISQETMALDKVNKSGALTVAFVQVIEGAQHALTYGTLLTRMKSTIYGMDNDKGGLRSKLYKLVTGMRRGALLQKPQLCANEPFDVYKTTFSL